MREWREFEHLTELPCLEDLVFIGNPLEEEATLNGNYTQQVSKRLMLLKKVSENIGLNIVSLIFVICDD